MTSHLLNNYIEYRAIYFNIWHKRSITRLASITIYNIASRTTQSNSVYVSVLKIPIVLADGVSKSLRKNFFFPLERPMQQILTERHSGKTKQMTNWSAGTLKGKLNFFVLRLFKNVKLKLLTERFKQNQFLFCLTFCLPGTITPDIVVRFWEGFDAQFHQLCYKTIGSCF